MSAEERLSKLGIELPPAPKPVGLYKPVVVVGNLAYLSGHGPLKSDGTLITGRVGEDMSLEEGQAAARQTALAMLSTLKFALGTLDRVSRVVKVLSAGALHGFLRPTTAGDQWLQPDFRRCVWPGPRYRRPQCAGYQRLTRWYRRGNRRYI